MNMGTPDFLSRFDGTGRPPRGVQVQALTWLSQNWNNQKVLCISAPTASGKSSIARAISLATGAHVLTPTNILIDQYQETFPKHNALKGKVHYSCSPQMTCYDWINECEQKPCENCPYKQAKERAATEPTFFNPMSYWYFTFTETYAAPKVLVVDEAHTLVSSLMMLCGVRLKQSEYRFPKNISDELALARWMDATIGRLERLRELSKKDRKKTVELSREISKLKMTVAGIYEDPQNFAIWTEEGPTGRGGRKETWLNIKPLSIPDYIRKRVLAAEKVILLSGTIVDSDVRDLVGDEPFALLDLPSPIPKENRQVVYRPVPFKMNYTTPPEKIVQEIERLLDEHPNQNTIIHVSYALSRRLRGLFTKTIIFNDPEDKDAKLEEFLTRGGIFLAAGCAEGIDLKGDRARLNIIPKLLFPDLNDPVVKKRRTLADGEDWYGQQTLKTLIQQCGRSTRAEDDYSKTFILDPTFPMVYLKHKAKLPAYFKEALVWSAARHR